MRSAFPQRRADAFVAFALSIQRQNPHHVAVALELLRGLGPPRRDRTIFFGFGWFPRILDSAYSNIFSGTS